MVPWRGFGGVDWVDSTTWFTHGRGAVYFTHFGINPQLGKGVHAHLTGLTRRPVSDEAFPPNLEPKDVLDKRMKRKWRMK